MRLTRQSVTVTTNSVVVCDPYIVGETVQENTAIFELWRGDGNYKMYSANNNNYFVDVDPRIFKAKTREGFSVLPGHVGVDTGQIGIFDLTPERRHAADDALADGWAIEISGLANRDYVAWFEEKGTSQELFRGVIGFGAQPVMLLNGEHGAQLQDIEDRIVKMFRMKGVEKQVEFQSVSQSLSDLHLDGCKDKRLRMLADAIKFKLPRRSSKR